MKTMQRIRMKLRGFWQDQHGGMAPFMVLGLAGVMFAGAYAFDATRMTTSAAQLKRATDAAAMAVGMKKLEDPTVSLPRLESIAAEYLMQNLGMDSGLRDHVVRENVMLQANRTEGGADTYEVKVTFDAPAQLLRVRTEQVSVASKVEVFNRPAEVALVLPNTLSEDRQDIEALKRLGKEFATSLLSSGQDNLWISLVPYSQAVSVYDENDPGRIRRWATAKDLRPPALTTLFRQGYRGLDDGRLPDRRAKLLCMYRGLALGQNYFWDQPPSGRFGVYYRLDLPQNGSPGAEPIALKDDRGLSMVADRGCPNAPLLPLTNDMDSITERLDAMSPRFNVNYAIAMGWAAHALSPAMRGSSGWGDTELPLDFSGEGRENIKAIVMLANTSGDWFDTDSYNFAGTIGMAPSAGDDSGSAGGGTLSPGGDEADDDNGGNETGGGGNMAARELAKRRFASLCRSFRDRDLKFYFIGVRPGDPDDFGRSLFGQEAVPNLNICTETGGKLVFADATDFRSGQPQIKRLLDDIAKEIRSKSSYVRLVE